MKRDRSFINRVRAFVCGCLRGHTLCYTGVYYEACGNVKDKGYIFVCLDCPLHFCKLTDELTEPDKALIREIDASLLDKSTYQD